MKIRLQPIYPKYNQFNVAAYEREIQGVILEAKNGVQADYKKTVATWSHKPRFYTTRRGWDWYIGTNDKIYGYVSGGTRPHIIKPKPTNRSGRLAFFSVGFKRKSRPGYIASYKGQKATRGFIRPRSVFHPGTEARKFDERIQEKWQKEFTKQMRAAIRRAARSRK